MPHLSAWELLLILAIVLLIFGASRITGVASALGSSLREFKRAASDENPADPQKKDQTDRQV